MEIKAIIRTDRLLDVVHALQALHGMPGLTVSAVRGFGRRSPATPGAAPTFDEVPLSKLEAVVDDTMTSMVVDVILRRAQTGRPGDGKIFIAPVFEAVQIRDGARRGREE